jgi:Ca2+-binding EF-hand superfamily protein
VATGSTTEWRKNVKKTTSLIAAAVLLALTAGAALAQSEASGVAPAPREHTPLDANKDGMIDRAEAAAHPRLAAQFDTLDTNRDGKLQRNELPRRPQGRDGRRHDFAALDTDGDGRVSKAEAGADPKYAERFAQMDANKDGFVDRTDREAVAKQRKDEWFKAADSNRDGSLSKAEFDAALAKRAEEGGKRGGPPAL